VKRPRTFGVTPKPSMDWVVQPLHLRNRRYRQGTLSGGGLSFRCFRRLRTRLPNGCRWTILSASARLLDTGIWVGLAFASHPQHRLAREMFEAADSERPVAFCRATQNSFLRLLTTPAIQALYGGPAVTNAQAWAKSQELLALPQVVWLAEPVALESEWKRFHPRLSPFAALRRGRGAGCFPVTPADGCAAGVGRG